MSLSALPRTVLHGLVRGYQLVISPWTPQSCRYYPSCSQYALVALERHGAARGSWLALRRLARCHPWCEGGVDDVPPARESARTSGADTQRGAASAERDVIVTAAPGGPTVRHAHAERARSSAR